MAEKYTYDCITKYIAKAVCTEPLHIGNAIGDKEEVLVHSTDDLPFIQASSIAGVFREYCMRTENSAADELFGAHSLSEDENAYEYRSKVRFSDGIFITQKQSVMLELRPRLAINRETGTCGTSIIKGTDCSAGHKFQMEYIGAGAEFSFSVYVYGSEYCKKVEEIFAAINCETVQFGGQKSNGCGYIKIQDLKRKQFQMTSSEDRILWANEDELPMSEYTDLLSHLDADNVSQGAFEIIVSGKTEGSLLVKSIAVTDYQKNAPDCMNLQNVKGDYIVPGSSFKGAVRSQMQKIAAYLEEKQVRVSGVVEASFGKIASGEEKSVSGNICFFDTVIGEKYVNDNAAISHRIHIDKFTGGVMHGGLFSEKNIHGEMTFRIRIADKNEPKKTCALLLMALRDLAAGTMSVGSGYNIGKGMICVDKIIVTELRENSRKSVLDFSSNQVKDDRRLISECMQSLYGTSN